jgi:hypothetical protein
MICLRRITAQVKQEKTAAGDPAADNTIKTN